MALVVSTLASCSSDNVMEGITEPTVPTGVDTYASFKFRVEGGTLSRGADMVTDEGLNDATVNDLRLLIFSGENGMAGKLLTNTLVETNKTATIVTTSGSKRIYVIANTKGKTQIEDKLVTLTVNASTLQEFYALMTDGKYTGTTTDDKMGEGFGELFTDGKFVMSNVADITSLKVLQPGITKEQSEGASGTETERAKLNNFNFTVFRAIAKGNLTIKLKEAELQTSNGIFQLKPDASYGVRNVNRSTLYVQQYASDNVTAGIADHHTAGGIRPYAAYYNVFDNTSDADMMKLETYTPYFYRGYAIKPQGANLSELQAQPVTIFKNTETAKAGKTVFFSGNSNNRQVRGNTTYIGITTQVAKIEAKNIVASVSYDQNTNKFTTTAAQADYDNTDGDKSFWYIREIPADMIDKIVDSKVGRIFVNEDVAFDAMIVIWNNLKTVNTPAITTAANLKTAYNNYKAGNGTPILTAAEADILEQHLGFYENGRSYYRLNIYEKTDDDYKRHLIRRNHIYQAMVTGFATIGEPTEEDLDKDPEKPVDADVTNVTATITVATWHTVDMEDDL